MLLWNSARGDFSYLPLGSPPCGILMIMHRGLLFHALAKDQQCQEKRIIIPQGGLPRGRCEKSSHGEFQNSMCGIDLVFQQNGFQTSFVEQHASDPNLLPTKPKADQAPHLRFECGKNKVYYW